MFAERDSLFFENMEKGIFFRRKWDFRRWTRAGRVQEAGKMKDGSICSRLSNKV
jgi:hypothetical protein